MGEGAGPPDAPACGPRVVKGRVALNGHVRETSAQRRPGREPRRHVLRTLHPAATPCAQRRPGREPSATSFPGQIANRSRFCWIFRRAEPVRSGRKRPARSRDGWQADRNLACGDVRNPRSEL